MTERDGAIDWLLKSDEPAIRYRTRTWLLGEPETNAKVKADRKAAWDGPIVSTLLEFTPESKKDPYRKWWGLHWRLVSLANLRAPAGSRGRSRQAGRGPGHRAGLDRQPAPPRCATTAS